MKTLKFDLTILRFFVIIVLAIGIFFRFYNLDKKVYWIDEVHTSLRVAGYKKTKFDDRVTLGQPIAIEQLQQFQTLSPETTWGQTFDALAGNAEHAPIYYLLTRWWMQWFGSSVAVTRSVAATLSLLAFPAIYWLCLELFEDPAIAWVAMSLIAVSPLHLLYAQEARQYSLWTVMTLVSSWALLRSLRLNTRRSWAIYAATVILGFYSHLISGLVFFGQGVYVFFLEGCRWTKRLKSYLLASLAGFIALIPWIAIYFNNESSIGVWMAREIPLRNLVVRWGFNLSSVFFDLHVFYPRRLFDVEAGQDLTQFGWGDIWVYGIIPIAILVGYAIYWVYRTTAKRIWLFLLTIIAANGLFLMLYDVVSGGQRSGIARYLFPAYLAIQLAVAYLLGSQIDSVGLMRPNPPAPLPYEGRGENDFSTSLPNTKTSENNPPPLNAAGLMRPNPPAPLPYEGRGENDFSTSLHHKETSLNNTPPLNYEGRGENDSSTSVSNAKSSKKNPPPLAGEGGRGERSLPSFSPIQILFAKPFFWKLLYVILITAGIISCAVSAEAETWWNKYSCYYNAEVAQIVNRGETPLVIGSSDRVSRLTSLSYKLDAKVRLLILEDGDRVVIPDNFSDIFLFRPSLELYQNIEANPNYQLKPLHPFGHIWQVEK